MQVVNPLWRNGHKKPAAVLASAWDVAQLANNINPNWDALLAGNENDNMLGAAKILMGAISIYAHESNG